MRANRSVCFAACIVGILGSLTCAGQGSSAATDATQAAPGDAVPGRLIKQVQPVYQGIAAANQVDGNVVMRVTITADGTVTNVRVIHGLPQLINSAVHAVSQWLYEPYRVNGVATPVDTTIAVHFRFAKNMLTPSEPPQAEPSGPTPPTERAQLPPPPAGVMRISGRVMANMLDKKVDPVYPADSIAVDAKGAVVLLATIKKAGEVADVQVISGPERFRDAATNAVKQWHYRPYVIEGEAVEVQTTITLNFAPPPH